MLKSLRIVGLVALACTLSFPGAAGAAGLSDSFDDAVSLAPGFGLNDSLATRQGFSPAVTYTRVSGVWYPAASPPASYSQTNRGDRPGVLTFSQGTSAVRVDAPAVAAPDGRVSLRAVADPVVGEASSASWVSLMLSRNAGARGYVADQDIDLGVLIRSRGAVQVFQGGRLEADLPRLAAPDGQGRYAVRMAFSAGARTVRVTINGVARYVSVTSPLPGRASPLVGAYLDAPGESSTVDELAIGDIDHSSLALAPGSGLRYFGYYAARLAPEGTVTGGGNHLPEVRGRSNLNWVNISDRDRYAPEVLSSCAPKSCIVYAGNEFFQSCDTEGSPTCRLYPNYADRWRRLADVVRPYLDRVAAFSVLDEPYHRGATPQDVQTSAATMKSTFADQPVLMIEAGPKVTPEMIVPAAVDWVAFDWYCRPIADIERTLDVLESRAPADKRILLVPEAAPLPACGGQAGHATDAEIAALQWDYLHLAERHPRVIGLLAFGPWVSGKSPPDLPVTIDAHERIAARVLPAPLRGSGPAPRAAPRTQVADRAAPRISRIRLTRRRLSLRASEPAMVSATIARRTRGRRARWKTVVRRTLRARKAGTVRARLRNLRAGRYRVSVRARDAAGNRSRMVRGRATVRRRH